MFGSWLSFMSQTRSTAAGGKDSASRPRQTYYPRSHTRSLYTHSSVLKQSRGTDKTKIDPTNIILPRKVSIFWTCGVFPGVESISGHYMENGLLTAAASSLTRGTSFRQKQRTPWPLSRRIHGDRDGINKGLSNESTQVSKRHPRPPIFFDNCLAVILFWAVRLKSLRG